MINCQIIGRLTADPIVNTREIRGEKVKVANFTVAANQGYGENEKTEYFRVALWHKRADFAEQYLTKGRLVAVKGSMFMRSYIGTNGTPRTVLEFGSDVEVEAQGAGKGAAAEAAPEAAEVIPDDENPDYPF
jgi:single-strand DNA-binding protein